MQSREALRDTLGSRERRAKLVYSFVQTFTDLIAPSASLRNLKADGPTSTIVLVVGFCSTTVHFFVVVSWTM